MRQSKRYAPKQNTPRHGKRDDARRSQYRLTLWVGKQCHDVIETNVILYREAEQIARALCDAHPAGTVLVGREHHKTGEWQNVAQFDGKDVVRQQVQ